MWLNRFDRWNSLPDPLSRLSRLAGQFTGTGDYTRRIRAEFPTVNISANEENVIVQAEMPGVAEEDVDITVQNRSFVLRGTRKPLAPADGETVHRQESFSGEFVRSFTMPYPIDADKTSAAMKNGLLRVTLPRHADDKPQKISVRAE